MGTLELLPLTVERFLKLLPLGERRKLILGLLSPEFCFRGEMLFAQGIGFSPHRSPSASQIRR